MKPVTKEAVIGGLYLMWRGNPSMTLGQLVETFAGAEGFAVAEVPDEEWPQRDWEFCPWCGSADVNACMDRGREQSCINQLWD